MLLALCPLAEPSQAQDAYPSRPIRLIVPYPAGGTADAMARALGQELTTAGDNRSWSKIAPAPTP